MVSFALECYRTCMLQYRHRLLGTVSYAVLLVALLASTPARADFVDLTADLETTSWSWYDAPPMVSTRMWNLHCIVGTNTWLITASGKGVPKETWWYTGSNLVS